MNKQEYTEKLGLLVNNALSECWEANQAAMINDFYNDAMDSLYLVNEDHVFYDEELIESAQRYQSAWAYENNRHLTSVF